MLTPTEATTVCQWIVKAEARRDKAGKLKVYKLPDGDGGGTYEVAGINDRYHPAEAAHLAWMIANQRQDEAEEIAAIYIQGYTNIVQKWGVPNAAEAYLRDCVWNRGPKGALRILQRALNVADDGKFGTLTKAAIKDKLSSGDGDWLRLLRDARVGYERHIAPPVGARAKFWPGLLARFDDAAAMALPL